MRTKAILAALAFSLLVLGCGGGTNGNTVVSDFSPKMGKVGDQVDIFGTGLGGTGGSVTIGGVTATVLQGDDQSITVKVPAGAMTGKIVVNGVSNSATFTVTM